jgi:hypothetical protein
VGWVRKDVNTMNIFISFSDTARGFGKIPEKMAFEPNRRI